MFGFFRRKEMEEGVQSRNRMYAGAHSVHENQEMPFPPGKAAVKQLSFRERMAGRRVVHDKDLDMAFVERDRNRRICFYFSALLFVGFITFLGSRAFKALEITSTTPVLSSFALSQLCSDAIAFTAKGNLDNPSILGAAVDIAELKLLVEGNLIGAIVLPIVDVPAGKSEFDISGTLQICSTCLAAAQAAVQNYLNGVTQKTTVEAALTASFASDVFIFPIDVSTSLSIDAELEGFFDPTETKADRAAAAATANGSDSTAQEENSRETVDTIQLLQADNSTVGGLVGLNFSGVGSGSGENRTRFLADDFELFVDLPRLSFKGLLDGAEVGIGSSEPGVFGGPDLFVATLALGWADVLAVNSGVSKFQAEEDMAVGVTGFFDASLYTPEELSTGSCFINNLIEGVSLQVPLEFFNETAGGVSSESGSSSNDSNSIVQLETVTLNNITSEAVAFLGIDVDTTGLLSLFNFRGAIPPLGVGIRVNSSALDARDEIGSIQLESLINVTDDPSIEDVNVEIDINNASLFLGVMEHILGSSGIGRAPSLYISTLPTNLLTTLLQTFELEVSLGSSAEDPAPVARRILQGSGSGPVASVGVEVDSTSFELTVDTSGITKDDLFGFDIVIKPLEATVFLERKKVFDLRTGEINSVDQEFASLNVVLNVSDPTGGSLFVSTIEDFQNYETLLAEALFSYDGGALQRVLENITRTNWTAARPDDTVVSVATSTSIDGGLVNLKHVELDSTRNAADFVLLLQLDLNLEFSEFDLTLPSIALSLTNCDPGATLLEIITQPVVLFVANDGNFTEFEVLLRAGATADLVDSASLLASGEDLSVCIAENSEVENFLAKFISAFSLTFTFTSEEEVGASVSEAGANVEALDLVIESDSSSACLNLSFEVDPYSFTEEDFSVGWGDFELRIGDGDSFLAFDAAESFLGECSSYWATSPCANPPVVVVDICLFAENDVNDGVNLVRDVISDTIIFQNSRTFDISGTVTSRRSPSKTTTPYATTFTLPDNALDKVTQGTGSGGSGGGGSEESGNALGLEIALLSLDDRTVDALIASSVFDDIGSVTITLPLIEAALTRYFDDGADTTKLIDIAVDFPPAASAIEATVSAVLSGYPELFDTLELFGAKPNNTFAVEGNPGGNFLSRIIPQIVFGGDSGDAEPSSSPSTAPASTIVTTRISSTATEASITVSATTSSDIGANISWEDTSFAITDTSNTVATVNVAKGVFGYAGSSSGVLTLTFSGSANIALFAGLFQGSALNLGVTGTTGTNSFQIPSLTVPASLLTEAALGSENRSDAAQSSSLGINEVVLLGGSTVGSNIVLPCLVDGYCQNLLKDESTQTYTGLTFGTNLTIGEAPTSSTEFVVELDSDLSILVSVNGLALGQVRVDSGLQFSTRSSDFLVVASAEVLAGQYENARSSIDLFLEGFDLVLTAAGAPTENYLSNMLSAIAQDFFFESTGNTGDSESVGQIGDGLTYGLLQTTRQLLQIGATVPITYDGDLPGVPLGVPTLSVLSGHDSQGDNGLLIATATLNANDGSEFSLLRNPVEQNISVVANAQWTTAQERLALETVVSNFVFGVEQQLEIGASFTPSVRASKYSPSVGTFSLQTWFTLPQQGLSLSSDETDPSEKFLALDLNIGGSVGTTIASFDVQVEAAKVVRNILQWPIIVSYFTYDIYLYDTDGAHSDGCSVLNVGDVGACVFALTLPSNFCPNSSPAPLSVADVVEGGNLVMPLNGPNGNVEVQPNDTSILQITLNPSVSTAARLYEEFTRDKLCADVRSGVVAASMQADRAGCTDTSSTLEANLQCTFMLQIRFELTNFAFNNDTCVGVQEDLANFVTFDTGFANFASFPLSRLSVTNRLTFKDGGTDQFKGAVWEQGTPLSATDSFEISWTHRLTFGSFSSDSYSLVFKVDQPTSDTQSNFDLDFGYKGITNSVGLNFFYEDCMEFRVLTNGSDANKLFYTYSLLATSFLKDTQDVNMKVEYDASAKRMRVSSGPDYVTSFDFDLAEVLSSMGTPNVREAYIGFAGNSNNGFLGTTFTTIEIKNVAVSTDATSSDQATVVDPVTLPVAGTRGTLIFQARTAETRKRGSGGDTWAVSVVNGDGKPFTTTDVLSLDGGLSSCTESGDFRVCDNNDGTYTVHYVINDRGRYEFSVNCVSGGTCVGTGLSLVTRRVFVRDSA